MTTYLIFTRGVGFISRRIAALTRPPGMAHADVPSHVLIMFASGEGFEAHAHTGGWNRIRASNLADWMAERPGRAAWHVELDSGYTDYWRARCERQIGLWPYDVVSCIRHVGWRRFHLPIRRSTPGAVTCSEAVGRILYDAIDLPGRAGHPPGAFDRLTPVDVLQALTLPINPGLPRTGGPASA